MVNGRIIVAGHACLDITPMFPEGMKANKLSEILVPGRLVNMEGVDINPGGAVSNTGIAMKLLGGNVSLASKIGNDAFGDIITDIYKGYGAADGIIRVDGERTSYTTVISAPGFDRVFLHDPGANNTFSIEDVKSMDFTDVKLFHFGYPPIMKRMYADGGDELLEIYKFVKSKGVITSMDMTFVDDKSEAGRADWEGILKKVLPYVDIFVPSIEETCYMLDRARYNEWSERAGEGDLCMHITPDDVKPLADKLMDMGVKILLLKCGAPGLFYKTAEEKNVKAVFDVISPENTDECTKLWADKEGFEVSFKPSKVLSGTGAGDTTIAAFLTAMMQGESLNESVSLAAAEGASCVEAYGALGGIKTLDELKKKINDGWEKNQF